MKNDTIQSIRRDYKLRTLDETEVNENPMIQFEAWFSEAETSDVLDFTAFQLATVSPNGQPTTRVVLLKGIEPNGFVFFTNYESRKGTELSLNPKAGMGFYWPELERQVRIEGVVDKLHRTSNVAYFNSRPRESQLGAWASRQSSVVVNRQQLESEMKALRLRFEGKEIPCPEHWGGYVLTPQVIEFWQGREGRLHDRIRYTKTKESWLIQRLSP